VTLVAFVDFECPFCARGHETVRELREHYGPKTLRVVYKHAPLPFHSRALPAARTAQAVFRSAGPTAFFDYADVLFSNTRSLSADNLERWALEVGVSEPEFRRQVGSFENFEDVDRDVELAVSLGLEGVPAFLINGAALVGARPIGEFQRVIEHELRAAQVLREAGTLPARVYAERVKVNLQPSRELSPDNDQVAFAVPVGNSPSLGPSDAWVTIVEFADFECPYCRSAHSTIAQLMQRHPGKIRWVMKHNPLDFHPLAVPAALVALEVYRLRGASAYWAALDALLAEERLQESTLQRLTHDYELDLEVLDSALASGPQDARLVADRDLAMDLMASGTPHFFVNGRRVAGARPIGYFEQLVEEEFAKVQALERSGAKTPYQALQERALPPPGLVRVEVDAPASDSPSLGPVDAPVVVQMFSDFECAYCRRVMQTLDGLRERYPEKVRIVWRHLPLSFHENARAAATAAMELRTQRGDDAFWKMTDLLFGRSEAGPERLDRTVLARYASGLGADMARYEAAMRDGSHDAAIDRDVSLAQRLGITGTPTFVVNGYQLVGAQPLSRFERLVRLALQE
jgi:protein-disulfide isomerase